MAGLNKIMVIGNVGTDPEMRYTPSGSPVTSFRLATSRRYKNTDGERQAEETATPNDAEHGPGSDEPF